MKMFMLILTLAFITLSYVADSRKYHLHPEDVVIYPPPSGKVPSPEFDVDVHFHLTLEKVLKAVGGTVVVTIIVALIYRCRNFNLQRPGDVEVGVELNQASA